MRSVLFGTLLLLGCGKPAVPSALGERSPSRETAPAALAAVVEPQSSATFPPDDWTHAELVTHLAKRAVVLHTTDITFTSDGLPVAFLHEPPDAGQPGVLVALCRDHQRACEFAETLGPGAFAAGRFAIGIPASGRNVAKDANLLRRVSAAIN